MTRKPHAPQILRALPGADSLMERCQILQQAHAAIREVETAHREILVFRDIEGRSAQELTGAVNLSEPLLKRRLDRVRRRLRTLRAQNPYCPSSGRPDRSQVFSQ